MDDEVTLTMDHIIPIRGDDEYGGYRVAVIAKYESINTPLKTDITTGDIITPDAIQSIFHSNFEEKLNKVWASNIETILAEKVETILRKSVFNTRPRDFYDVYIIAKTKRTPIKKKVLITALNAASEKRGPLLALSDKHNILSTIQFDAVTRQRWEGYGKENTYATGIAFDDVIGVLIDFVN